MQTNMVVALENIDEGIVREEVYDAGIFASGYESRCTFLASELDPDRIRHKLVLGFEFAAADKLRASSNRRFRQLWEIEPLTIPGDYPQKIAEHIQFFLSAASSQGARLRLLVDYSSMSRLWYAEILNSLRFARVQREIQVDFNYSIGKYASGYLSELKGSSVQTISSIPMMEGLSASREATIALLGLGFSPTAGLSVLERIQPERVVCFYASPGATKSHSSTCRKKNSGLLSTSDFTLEVPLQDVAGTYRSLCEYVIPYLDTRQITIVPMGPKPHVLASLFLACRFRQVACLYAKMSREEFSDIPALGDRIVTRLVLAPRKSA